VENLNTDNLMRLQVEQLEKEKKGLTERLRFIGKRLDHTERAFRKEERPLLALDYERQQAEDRAAFELAQKRAIEEAREAHKRNLETKKRLGRMLDDFKSRKPLYEGAKGEEYRKKKAAAEEKIRKAVEERRETVRREMEEERRRIEEEERLQREEEEEERRKEEGEFALTFCVRWGCDDRCADVPFFVIFQNASQKKDAFKKKRRPSLPPQKQRNANRRPSARGSESSAKRRDRKHSTNS
jgi:translation initiation factor 3 subunit A